MIYGIGVDMVDISEFENLVKKLGICFIEATFTKRGGAFCAASEPIRFLAERFAVKEAVFKAIAHHTKAKTFDFRIVETLDDEARKPYVSINDSFKLIVEEAGICSIMVSLAKEKIIL